MTVLTRYLLRSHIAPFFFAFFTLTGVILINTLAKELANLAGKGLQMEVVLEFFVLSLPANIALTLPMSVLVAVLYTFSTLATENEVTALRANGVDLRRATLPLLIAATLIAGGMVWFNDQVLPASNYRWRILMTDLAQTRPLLALQEQTINPIRGRGGMTPYYLEARELDAATGAMRDVSIYDVSNDQITRTIDADSGRMVLNQTGTDLLLTLFEGEIREVDFNEQGSFQVFDFRQYLMRLTGVSDQLQRSGESSYRTDRDMTLAMMLERIDSAEVELASLRATANTPLPIDTIAAASADSIEGDEVALATARADTAVSATGTDSVPRESETAPTARAEADPSPFVAGRHPREYAASRARNVEAEIRGLQVEMHKKFSIAAAALVFVLIGIPTALRFPGSGIGMVVGVSLTIFGIYYVGLIGGETLANSGYVRPLVSMWLTNLVFGIIGLIGFVRLGHEQGTSRGSAPSEVLPRVLSIISRQRRRAEE